MDNWNIPERMLKGHDYLYSSAYKNKQRDPKFEQELKPNDSYSRASKSSSSSEGSQRARNADRKAIPDPRSERPRTPLPYQPEARFVPEKDRKQTPTAALGAQNPVTQRNVIRTAKGAPKTDGYRATRVSWDEFHNKDHSKRKENAPQNDPSKRSKKNPPKYTTAGETSENTDTMTDLS